MTSVLVSTSFARATAGMADAVWTPRHVRRETITRTAMFGPPHNNGPVTLGQEPLGRTCYSVASSGIPITCVGLNLNPGIDWGNATAIANFQAASDWHTGLGFTGATRRVLVAMSMGGLQSLNWARTHVSLIDCIALIQPCCSLDVAATTNGGAYLTELNAAYGGNYTSFKATNSPIEFAAVLNQIPINIWYASNDTIAPKSALDAFAAVHGNTTFTSMGGVGHNPFAVNTDEVAEWVSSH